MCNGNEVPFFGGQFSTLHSSLPVLPQHYHTRSTYTPLVEGRRSTHKLKYLRVTNVHRTNCRFTIHYTRFAGAHALRCHHKYLAVGQTTSHSLLLDWRSFSKPGARGGLMFVTLITLRSSGSECDSALGLNLFTLNHSVLKKIQHNLQLILIHVIHTLFLLLPRPFSSPRMVVIRMWRGILIMVMSHSGSYRTVSIVVATEELSRRGHEWPFLPAA